MESDSDSEEVPESRASIISSLISRVKIEDDLVILEILSSVTAELVNEIGGKMQLCRDRSACYFFPPIHSCQCSYRIHCILYRNVVIREFNSCKK